MTMSMTSLAKTDSTDPHRVQWTTASPLWNEAFIDPARMQRPALVRLATDNFMEDLTRLLQTNPQQLGNTLARPESFRARPLGESLDWQPDASQLKLYQPVHGHYNLVTASLVCRLAGLPDRTVDTAGGEKVSFVLRRLSVAGQEMAWVRDPSQPVGKDKSWVPLDDPSTLGSNEELLPLFPVNFHQNGRKRSLFVGLVPTSSRESYQAAKEMAQLPPDPTSNPADPRPGRVYTRVIEPLASLQTPENPLPANLSNAEKAKIKAAKTRQEKEASLFLMLDLADFLAQNLPGFWTNNILVKQRPFQTKLASLYDLLNTGITDPAQNGISWLVALGRIWQPAERKKLTGDADGSLPDLSYNLRNSTVKPAALEAALAGAFAVEAGPGAAQPGKAEPVLSVVPKLDPSGATQYLLRCVYQRPTCGPLKPDVISNPTEPFAIAGFFDFDAPARPIRITLPVDTSIAGLRKFNKNVAFVISDQLRQQMSRATDLKAAMDGNLAAGEEFNLGEICSFSIPIISICALIVLMIFINLLNIIFWWMPFLKICLPVGLLSKLKGQG